MRTTLTLDADVVKLLEDEVHRVRKPFKQIVNDALRRGLAPTAATKKATAYRVRPHAATFAPGFDRQRLNALADELEDYDVLSKVRPAGRAAERRR